MYQSTPESGILAHPRTDEEGAIKTLEARISKVPSFSKEMLRDKVFGAYEDDEEFQLVHFAMMPLYSEDYDANAGLKSCRNTVHVAESHSMVHLPIGTLGG